MTKGISITIIAVSLALLCSIAIAQTVTPRTYGLHAHKYEEPVSEQSCLNTPSQSYGWFWDGQKCESCANEYCTCKEYNQCDSCKDGYTKIVSPSKPNGFCVACPSFGTPYLNNRHFYTEPTGQKPSLASVHGSSTGDFNIHSGVGNIVKKCCNPIPSTNEWEDVYQKGLRATECIQGTGDQPVIYKLFGSVCWYMDGCTEYTNVGKCKKCYDDGYYLDDNQICRTCRWQCTEESGKLNMTAINALNIQSCGLGTGRSLHKPCATCSAANQCNTCIRGYYLAKATYFERQTDSPWFEETLRDASWCRKCAHNCHCTPSADGNFTYSPISESFYKDENGDCKPCNQFTNQKLCATCEYTPKDGKNNEEGAINAGGTFTCKTCVLREPGSSSRYVTETPRDGICLPCDEGCFRCTHFDNTTTTCKIGQEIFCKNGYRVANNTGTRVTCTKCENQDAQRCKTLSNGGELITQCKSENNADSRNYEPGVIGYHNRNLPSTGDYYLITHSSTDVKCVQNKNNCKKMKAQTADGLCTSCYLDKQYHLVNDRCIRCGVGKLISCAECSIGDLADGLQCSSCKDGTALDARDSNKKICVTCPSYCAKCGFSTNKQSTDGQCTGCHEGYQLDETVTSGFQCKPCIIDNCKACPTSPLICESCIDTYRLWKGSTDRTSRRSQFCEQCDWGCLQCTTERKQCTKCRPELYLWHGVCHRPKDHCVKMKGFDCEVCEAGYRRVDQQCLKCFDLEGGYVHCHQSCDISNTRWHTTVDSTWSRVNETSGGSSAAYLQVCTVLALLLLSLIM